MSAPKSIEYIQDLTPSNLASLTQLLTLPPTTTTPTTTWLTTQTHHLTSPTFPPQLKTPTSLLPKLIKAINIFHKPEPQAHLCKAHKILNPHLIHRLWVRVSAEATTRISRLRLPQNQRYLSPNVADFVKRLSSINSLWLSPEFYRTVFQAKPEDARYEEIPGGCEACILAVVGGRVQILKDLRASLLGRRRRRRRRKTSRLGGTSLLPMIEAWMDWMPESEELRRESERLARDIRYCRRHMQQVKMEQRRVMKRRNVTGMKGTEDENGSLRVELVFDPRNPERPQNPIPVDFAFLDEEEEEEEESNEKDEGEEHDFEGSIIDFYANLMSTASLVPTVYGVTEGMPPAFRTSVVFDPLTGTFQRAASEKHERNTVSSVYSQSVYSDAGTGIGMRSSSRQSLDPQNRSAEKHAQAYRNLVGIEEEEDRESVGNRTGQRRRVKRGTMI